MIFLFIPHYVYTSDLLHTKYINHLASKYRVMVFGPVFDPVNIESYPKLDNVEYVYMEAQHPNLWLLFNKTLRFSLIKEFDNLEYHKLIARTGRNLNWQRKLLKNIAVLLPNFLVKVNSFTKLESILLDNSGLIKDYIDKYQPELILTSTPGFTGLEAEAVLMAKKNNIKTVAINFSWDNIFNTAKQIRKTDYLIVWNNRVKNAACEIHGYLPKNICVSGTMRFDHHFNDEFKSKNMSGRTSFLTEKNLNPNLKTIFFTTVPPHTYPFQTKFLENLINLRDNGVFKENLNIITRLHPRDEIANYKHIIGAKNLHIEEAGQLKNQRPGDLHKIEMNESDLENLRRSLLYSNVAVNFRSSMTLETCLYDLPTINLAYHDYDIYYQMDHYIPILASGAVKLVKNQEEFINAMKNYLANPRLDSEKRTKISKELVPFQDGLAYKRNVDFLERII